MPVPAAGPHGQRGASGLKGPGVQGMGSLRRVRGGPEDEACSAHPGRRTAKRQGAVLGSQLQPQSPGTAPYYPSSAAPEAAQPRSVASRLPPGPRSMGPREAHIFPLETPAPAQWGAWLRSSQRGLWAAQPAARPRLAPLMPPPFCTRDVSLRFPPVCLSLLQKGGGAVAPSPSQQGAALTQEQTRGGEAAGNSRRERERDQLLLPTAQTESGR